MALSKESPLTIEELQAQLAAAQEQLAKADETIAAVTEEKQALAEEKQQLAAKADELSSQTDALKTQVADLQAKPSTDKGQAKVKKTMVLVVSATEFSYDIGNNQKATPDVPVKAERYEGNLLDSQMKAGYVVEYTGD